MFWLFDGSSRRSLNALLTPLALVAATWLATLPAFAVDEIIAPRCVGHWQPPLTFRIDCRNVQDVSLRDKCAQFIENQACLVYRAYRKITDIPIEKGCSTVTYTIYDGVNAPNMQGAGGLTLGCKVNYKAEYSIGVNSKLGPYDVHELLHVFQGTLGPLPDPHVIFGSSMAEAIRLIGDEAGYRQALQRMTSETKSLQDQLKSGANISASKCVLAHIMLDASLYLEDSQIVYRYYRNIPLAISKEQSVREARFSRMFFAASGNKDSVKRFLLDNGCAPF